MEKLNLVLFVTAALATFGCAQDPKTIHVSRELVAPKTTPVLKQDEAVRFLKTFFSAELRPPSREQSNIWETPMAAGGVVLPVGTIPWCDDDVEDFRIASTKTRVAASGTTNLVPCVRRALNSNRSDQEKKLLEALLESLEAESSWYVESSCSRRNLNSASNWKFSDLIKNDVPMRTCPNDQTHRFIVQSRKKISFRLGPDAPSSTISKAAMLPSGKPCVRTNSKGTLRMKRCSVWIESLQDGKEGDVNSKDVWFAAHAKDISGAVGQPWYASGTWTVSINNWKGSVKFQGTRKAPSFILSDGRQTVEGSFEASAISPAASTPMESAPTTSTPATSVPAASATLPETEPVVGVFQVLGFSPPSGTQSHILPYRDGKFMESNTKNIQPAPRQIACDRTKRTCWGITASDVGVIDLKSGSLQSLSQTSSDRGSTQRPPTLANLAGVAFDNKAQRLFVLAGATRGILHAWSTSTMQWSTLGQLPLENVYGMVFFGGDRNLHAFTGKPSPGRGVEIDTIHKLGGDGTKSTATKLSWPIPVGGQAALVQLIDANPWVLVLVSRSRDEKTADDEKAKFLPTTVYRIDPFTGTVHLIP